MGAIGELTPREREVSDLLVRGYNTPGIAKKLFISKRTVESHRAIIMSKFEITTIAELYEIINPSPLVIVLTTHPENTTVMVGADVMEGFYGHKN